MLSFVVLGIASARLNKWVRHDVFVRLATRSQPLIEAIKDYECKFGYLPETLSALVPEFLAEVAGTGLGAYPRYRYRVGKESRDDKNPWIIEVFTPRGGIHFDRFFYYPLGTNPECMWGGNSVERVGRWAYLHE